MDNPRHLYTDGNPQRHCVEDIVQPKLALARIEALMPRFPQHILERRNFRPRVAKLHIGQALRWHGSDTRWSSAGSTKVECVHTDGSIWAPRLNDKCKRIFYGAHL